MVNISKLGDSAIKFTFTENDRYLYNGEITVPLNSLILVFDESDMVVIKKTDGDVFLTFLIDNTNFSSKADLESWFKENAFDAGITQEEVQDMIDESISGLAESSAVTEEITAAVSGKADSSVVTSLNGVVTGHTADTTIHVTSNDKEKWNKVDDKLDASAYTPTDLSQYWTSAETENAITAAVSGKADTSDVQNVASDVTTVSGDVNTLSGSVNALTGAVNTLSGDVSTLSGKVNTNETILTGHTANTDIHVTASDKQNWNNKSDFSGSYNDLTDKPTIPTVPTNVSDFTNDAGYATSGYVDSSVSGKADTSAVTASIAEAVSGKQDTLVSGTNIKTINNESLLGSGNIDIQGGGGNNVIELTQAQYDALTDIDPDAFYIITDADGGVSESAFTAHTANTSIHVTSTEKAAWNAKSDFSGDYNDLTNKPTIPTVPTSNTAFTNDAGYITSSALDGYATTGDVQTATADMATKTWVGNQGYLTEHQSLSNYYTKSETSGATEISTALASKADTSAVTESINAAVSGKADTSAFTAHTADTTIHTTSAEKTSWNGAATNASNAITALGGLKLVQLTQAQYDALATKDASTLYIITGSN